MKRNGCRAYWHMIDLRDGVVWADISFDGYRKGLWYMWMALEMNWNSSSRMAITKKKKRVPCGS